MDAARNYKIVSFCPSAPWHLLHVPSGAFAIVRRDTRTGARGAARSLFAARASAKAMYQEGGIGAQIDAGGDADTSRVTV